MDKLKIGLIGLGTVGFDVFKSFAKFDITDKLDYLHKVLKGE